MRPGTDSALRAPADMDPGVIDGDQWGQIGRLMVYLYLFTGLGLTAAMAFLLGHAIVPSLVASNHAPRALNVMRWIAYPLSAAALALTLYALGRALALVLDVVQQVY